MRLASLVLLALATTLSHAAPLAELANLKAGDRHHRFETSAVYLDAADRPMGARFLHRPTGFKLDLLQIESVPQAFTWVKTFPPPTRASRTRRSTCCSARHCAAAPSATRTRCRW